MIDDIELLNRLFQKSRTTLPQRLACKNEQFLAAIQKAVVNPNRIFCSTAIHVSFDEIGEADDRPLPFQVAIHPQRGFGVLRWNTFEEAVTAREKISGAIPRAKFQSAKDCDLSTQAIIDLESLGLMITMTRNLSLRLSARAM